MTPRTALPFARAGAVRQPAGMRRPLRACVAVIRTCVARWPARCRRGNRRPRPLFLLDSRRDGLGVRRFVGHRRERVGPRARAAANSVAEVNRTVRSRAIAISSAFATYRGTVAAEQNADPVVYGTRGHGGLTGAILGSVAQR